MFSRSSSKNAVVKVSSGVMSHFEPISLLVNFSGFKRAGHRRQRAELVAGGRQIRDAVAAIKRQRIDRLDDHAGARRNQVVDPRERLPERRGALAVEIDVAQIEPVEPNAADELQPARQLDLILNIDGRQIQIGLVPRVGGQAGEVDVLERRRVRAAEIGVDVVVPLLKKPVNRALADCWLPNSVPNTSVCFHDVGVEFIGPVGLVQEVLAIVAVVVGRHACRCPRPRPRCRDRRSGRTRL